MPSGFITKIQCRGGWCDDQRFEYVNLPNCYGSGQEAVELTYIMPNTFGSTSESYQRCPETYWMIGWKCIGSYCGQKKIRCSYVFC